MHKQCCAKWLSMTFSGKISLQKAMTEVGNKPAAYADLLNIPDTSILKVEFYSKKQAQDMVGKDEGKNGLVLVTLHKKHFPFHAANKDSAVYIIDDNGDTVRCIHTAVATLDGDTTGTSWNHFLIHSLKGDVPAVNGAPPGVYFVDMRFLVNKDGSVSDVTILEDPGYGTAAEVKV